MNSPCLDGDSEFTICSKIIDRFQTIAGAYRVRFHSVEIKVDSGLMLLPDLDVLSRWVGHRSLGALLLDKESQDRELHTTEHKILNDLRCGKSVSSQRIKKLVEAIASKWRKNDDTFLAEFHEILRKAEQGEAFQAQFGSERECTLLFWRFLAKNLPEEFRGTRGLLEGLLQKSIHLHEVYRDGGIQAVAVTLSDFGQHPSVGIVQYRFLAEMIELIDEGKEGIAQVELAAFGALLLSAVFLQENELSAEATRDSLIRLFSARLGRVDPLRSFARWLERLEDRTGYAKDRLLWDGFVHPSGEKTTMSEQDPRNLLRNPRRYRSGGQVPSFTKAQACLRSLSLELEENEQGKWKLELEQRKFGVYLILLVTNSARSIKKIGGVPERPCQSVYDLFSKGTG